MPRQPLGTVIFQKGLLTAEQLLEALDEGHRSRRRLGDILLERGWLDERALAETLAEQYGLPLVELEQEELDVEAARLISAADSDRLGAIVIGFEDGAPVVAISDPSNTTALAELETLLGIPVHFAVAAPSKVARALANVFSPGAEHEPFSQNGEAPAHGQLAAADEEMSSGEAAGADADLVYLEPDPPAPADDFGQDEPAAQTAEHATEWPFAGPEVSEPEHAPTAGLATTFASDSLAADELEPEADHASDQREARSDDFLWAPAAAPDPVPSEPAGGDAAAEVAQAPAVFEHVPLALVGSHEAAAWPEAEPAQDDVIASAEAEADGEGPPLSDGDPRPEPPALTEAEPAPSPFADDGRFEALEAVQHFDDIRADDDVPDDDVPPDDDEADDGAPDESIVSVVLVLRLSNGEVVELADFADRASASTRAATLVEQLIADEPRGWTSIDGRHFRLQAILAVDIVPAAI